MVVVAVSTLGVVLAEVMEIFELAFEEEDDPASPVMKKIWDAAWQNQQNGMCAQRRLRSAWASAQSDRSLHCPRKESLGP